MTRQHQQLSGMYSLTDTSYCPAFSRHRHTGLCVKLNYTPSNLLLPPTWLTLTLCPTTQHRRLADWSRDRQAGAAHVTDRCGKPLDRGRLKNRTAVMQPYVKVVLSIDGAVSVCLICCLSVCIYV